MPILILVWIHGFKGSDQTFQGFPERVCSVLRSSNKNLQVHNSVYPSYETRGDLDSCVDAFVDWLTLLTAETESNADNKAEKARVVLMGHSMGGLVAADAFRRIAQGYASADAAEALWPRIIGILAFDTPYLGVHPAVFANTAGQYLDHASKAHAALSAAGLGLGAFGLGAVASKGKDKGKSNEKKNETDSNNGSWARWGLAAAGSIAAVGGAAFLHRDTLAGGQTWITSHLEFVGALWNVNELNKRLEDIEQLGSQMGTSFHCFYTFLGHPKRKGRTFILLPSNKQPPHFSKNVNTKAENEIDAHTTMFDEKLNDGSFGLGSETLKHINKWIRASVDKQRNIDVD